MAPLTDSGTSYSTDYSNVASDGQNGYAQPHLLSLVEVAGILRVQPERIQWLSQVYTESLSATATQPSPQYTHSDLATLINAQRLEEEARERDDSTDTANVENTAQNGPRDAQTGYVPSQFDEYRRPHTEGQDATGELTDTPIAVDSSGWIPSPATADSAIDNEAFEQFANPQTAQSSAQSAPPATEPNQGAVETTLQTDARQADSVDPAAIERAVPKNADEMLGEMLSTVATSQQSVLNVQDSIREMLNVIAQDNFNLKHENRKLRERMLELERVIAEHQRREETRKEMLESRMRAVEGTLSALQQQLAQLVQLQRQRIRKNWFK